MARFGQWCLAVEATPGCWPIAMWLHDDDPELPWWRVVRADGSLAKGDRQRALLRAEGVPFRGRRVDMDRARVTA